MAQLIRRNGFVLKKTVSYYFVHMAVAAAVAYAVTGDLLAAVTLSLLEPTVQAVVFFFHEKVWQRHVGKSSGKPTVDLVSVTAQA